MSDAADGVAKGLEEVVLGEDGQVTHTACRCIRHVGPSLHSVRYCVCQKRTKPVVPST